jgi:hypothetical protein
MEEGIIDVEIGTRLPVPLGVMRRLEEISILVVSPGERLRFLAADFKVDVI